MPLVIKSINYNSLYTDYINGEFNELQSPLNIDWRNVSAKNLPLTSVQQQTKKILKNQNSDLSSENAKKYLQILDDPDAEIIITGQQLGLFLSPIYTIYKAITVIKLVEKLNRDNSNRKKYIPVFWLETEDHDFPEINHFGIWNSSMQPQELTYNGKDYKRKSIRHYQISDDIGQLFTELSEKLIETEFTPDLLSLLKKNYSPGTGWVSGTRELFKQLFHDQGLLFFEPGHPEIKSLSTPFFIRLLKNTEKISELFLKRSQVLAASGYPNQVMPLRDKTFVHIEDEQQNRIHAQYRDGNYYLNNRNLNLSTSHLEDFVTRNAQKLSTTVVSRPVLQSWFLPVAAYVAGPAEIAYWAQLSPLFAEFDLSIPAIYPRISMTLIEPKINRFIDKHEIDLSQMARKESDFLNNYFSEIGVEGMDPFPDFKESVFQSAGNISEYLKSVDPTLIPSVQKLIEKIQNQIDVLANKTLQARQRKAQTVTNQLEQVHHAIFPEGHPQERFVSIIYFLNKYGPGIINELIDGMDCENFQHQVIAIGKR